MAAAEDATMRGRRGWAAMIFPIGTAEVFGAVRGSRRLHWTQQAARREAETWADEMGDATISWETLDDLMAIGRIRGHAVVIRSILLPLGPPPNSETC